MTCSPAAPTSTRRRACGRSRPRPSPTRPAPSSSRPTATSPTTRPPGFSGNAVFTYTLNDNDPDGNATDTGTITINVPATPRVWYVDNAAAAGGDGTSDGPFDALADVTGATGPDAAGDIIYLFTGSGAYTGGITLLNTQTLHGAGTALVVSGTTLAAGRHRPDHHQRGRQRRHPRQRQHAHRLHGRRHDRLRHRQHGHRDGRHADGLQRRAQRLGQPVPRRLGRRARGHLREREHHRRRGVRHRDRRRRDRQPSRSPARRPSTTPPPTASPSPNSAANATFTGLVTILNDAGGANGDGVDLPTNTGTYSFNGGVSITVNGTGAFGFRAQSSGTVNIPDPNGTNQITSNNGTALLINPTTLNATLATVTSTGGIEGISLSGMSGSLTIGSVDIDGQTGDGIDITNSPGTVTINGGTIGATNDPAGIGVDINGGAGERHHQRHRQQDHRRATSSRSPAAPAAPSTSTAT